MAREATSTLSHHLSELIDNCQIYDELPHSVDDSIVDRLVDSITFDEETFEVVRRLMRNTIFESTRTIPLKIILRLVGAALNHDTFIDDEPLKEFILSSEVLLQQTRRAHVLISTLFQFYTNPKVFEVRKINQWSAVKTHALSGIANSRETVFLRRDFRRFLEQYSSDEARCQNVISGVLQIFVDHADGGGHGVDSVIDETTKILEKYFDSMELGECNAFVFAVRSAGRLGESTLNLIVKLKLHHEGLLNVSLTPGAWHNESNRVNVICALLEQDDSSDEVVVPDDVNIDDSNHARSTEQLIGLALYSSACTLHHKTRILHKMNETQVLDVLSQVKNGLGVENAVAMSDVTFLLDKLSKRISFAEMARFFETIGLRMLESTELLKKLCSIYGNDVLLKEEFAKVKTVLRSEVTALVRKGAHGHPWEETDTALELVALFPYLKPDFCDVEALGQRALSSSSPYVLSGVLEMMRDHFGGIPDEYLHKCMFELFDSRPRVICMKYLSTPEKFSSLEAQEVEKYLEAAFRDNDVELLREALKLAEKALPKYRDTVANVLDEHKNDRTVGRLIRRLLHEDHVQEESCSIELIREMLASLQVAGNNADDVKDCY